MIRFSHTLFALPFAMLSAVMAWVQRAHDVHLVNQAIDLRQNVINSTPMLDLIRRPVELQPIPVFRWQELLGIVLCMVFARSTAMAFNRLADRKLDALNPRTRMRHLPAGTLSVAGVTAFALACAGLFVASTLLFLPNPWPLYLSGPVLAFLCGYSFTKRFTSLAHFWLGTALALSPLAAWIAILGSVAWPPAVLGGAVLLWVAGFDIIYACQDYEVDRSLGLRSVPARFGVAGALRWAAVCHAGTVLLLALLPLVYPLFGGLYWAGITAVAGLLFYEHRLVRPDDLTRVNAAFFHVNAVVSLGLFLIGTVDLLI